VSQIIEGDSCIKQRVATMPRVELEIELKENAGSRSPKF